MRLLLVLLLFLSLKIVAQTPPQLVAKIKGSVSSHGMLNIGGYGNLEAHFGTQFATIQNGEINTGLVYQFSTSGFYFNDLDKLNSSTGIMANFLGGSFSYIFLKKERIVRPFFEMDVLFRVGSNFNKNHPSSGGYITLSEELKTDDFGDYLYSNRYTTPFVVRFLLGCDFRVNDKFHLSISAGYEMRTTKTKLRKEYLDYDTYDENNPSTSKKEKDLFKLLSLGFGVNYYFSLKKSEK